MSNIASGRLRRKRSRISYQELETSDIEDLDSSTVLPNDGDFDPTSKPQKRARVSKKGPVKKSVFPFFGLPRELRDEIYELALTDSRGVLLKASNSLHRRVPRRIRLETNTNNNLYVWRRRNRESGERAERLAPGLLGTCRAVYEEALPVLYGQPLAFLDTRALHNFLTVAGPSNIALLKDVSIEELHHTGSCKTIARPAFALLAPATQLRKLSFNSRVAWSYSRDVERMCAKIAKKLFPTCFDLLEIWVREDLRKSDGEMRDVVAVFQLQQENFNPNFDMAQPGVKELFRREMIKLIRRNIDKRYN